jgi:hypothetical protein
MLEAIGPITIGIIALVYLFASALFCQSVAIKKGFNGWLWALGGFFFGIMALIAVAGLPDCSRHR